MRRRATQRKNPKTDKINKIFKIQLETSFYSYDSKIKNEKAFNQIKKYVKDVLNTECYFIPICVEKDENNFPIEDATIKSKIKII